MSSYLHCTKLDMDFFHYVTKVVSQFPSRVHSTMLYIEPHIRTALAKQYNNNNIKIHLSGREQGYMPCKLMHRGSRSIIINLKTNIWH